MEQTLRDILVSAFKRHSKLNLQDSEWLIEWTKEESTQQPVICLNTQRDDKEITLLGRITYGSFTKAHRFFLKEQTESAVVYVTELMLDHLVFDPIFQELEENNGSVKTIENSQPVAEPITIIAELSDELQTLPIASKEEPKEEPSPKKNKNKQSKEPVVEPIQPEPLKETLQITEASYSEDKLSVSYEFSLNAPIWLKGFIRNNQGKDYEYDGSEWLFFSDLGEHTGVGSEVDVCEDLGLEPGVYDIQIRTDKDANVNTTSGELVSRSFQFTVE